MPKLRLTSTIHAPRDVVFDLSRSVDAHKASVQHTHEEAIAGVTSGLMGLGDEVTWRAKHFGVWQTLTSRITRFERPLHFRDSMVRGTFKRFDHDHIFHELPNNTTLLEDIFDYEAPLGPLGRIAESLVLNAYMTRFLKERNRLLKELAESEDWKMYIV